MHHLRANEERGASYFCVLGRGKAPFAADFAGGRLLVLASGNRGRMLRKIAQCYDNNTDFLMNCSLNFTCVKRTPKLLHNHFLHCTLCLQSGKRNGRAGVDTGSASHCMWAGTSGTGPALTKMAVIPANLEGGNPL